MIYAGIDVLSGLICRPSRLSFSTRSVSSAGAMMLAEIGDISRFDSSDKALAYAGLSPSTYQPGQLTSCYSHMEKCGSRYLRFAIFNATKYVCLWEPYFAAYFFPHFKFLSKTFILCLTFNS